MSDLEQSSQAPQGKTTFEGRVEILGDFSRRKLEDQSGVKRGVKHSGLFLKTDNGRIAVHLGPAAYFLQHNFQIKVGDVLRVTGFQVVQGAMPLVQASEVRTQGGKLKLRDKNGQPLWPAAMERTY